MIRICTSIWPCFIGIIALATGALIGSEAKPSKSPEKSIEQKTKIHRLDTQARAPYDAFTYLNRIPAKADEDEDILDFTCLLYTSPSPRDGLLSRMPSSA